MSQISRRLFLSGLAASVGGQALAGAPLVSPRPVPRPSGVNFTNIADADTLIAEARLGQAAVSFVVADARTGQVLDAKRGAQALPPASVSKVPTTLYGLDRLGADYRFTTRLVATGPVSGGQINGDLVLVGGGDPTTDTDKLGAMAVALRDAGVRGVTGAFKVYAGAIPFVNQIDNQQPPHVGYNPSVSGLNLNYNRVFFEWKQQQDGYDIVMDARAERYSPHVNVSSMSIVNRDLPVYTYRAGDDGDHWTVAHSALGDGGGRWLPVRRPEIYTAEVFQTIAGSYGISLGAPQIAQQIPPGTVLVSSQSDSLTDIAKGMLRHSTNITAEAIGLSATVASGIRPANLRASGRQMQAWMQSDFGAGSARFVDHSGLGGASRLSAQDMVGILTKSGSQSTLWPILKEISIENSPLTLRAKTGSLNFVSTLAGYIRTGGGRDLSFAIFAADVPRRNALTEAERERPEGGRSWSRRARNMQFQLVQRWGELLNS